MTEEERPAVQTIVADAARASVTPHTVHIELATSQPNGTLVPALFLRLSSAFAAELCMLLLDSVERTEELRRAIDRAAVAERQAEVT
jgi:hypothetical protein